MKSGHAELDRMQNACSTVAMHVELAVVRRIFFLFIYRYMFLLSKKKACGVRTGLICCTKCIFTEHMYLLKKRPAAYALA